MRRQRQAQRLRDSLRVQLERRLAALDSSWAIIRDGHVDGAPVPVTIAVGPTGIWVLWVPDPLNTGYHPAVIAEAIASPLGVTQEQIYLRPLYGEIEIEHALHAMMTSKPWFSGHHAVQWAHCLETAVGPDRERW